MTRPCSSTPLTRTAVRELADSIRAETTATTPTIATAPIPPAMQTATTATPSAAMWAIDPTGRHEYRYWSGTVWTAHVADQGVEQRRPAHRSTATRTAHPSPARDGPADRRAPGSQRARVGDGGPVVTAAGFDPTAVMGRRYGAFFIDVAISIAVFTVVFFAFATQRSVPETLRLPECHLGSNGTDNVECDNRVIVQLGDTVYEADALPTIGIDVVFTLLYFGILEGVAGATLGKRRHRAPRRQGRRLGAGRGEVAPPVAGVRGRRAAVALPLRHHHDVDLARAQATRRHGRGHVRRGQGVGRPPSTPVIRGGDQRQAAARRQPVLGAGESWRRRREFNPRTRFCRPLPEPLGYAAAPPTREQGEVRG